jgi:hypothetical protein
MPLPSPFTDWDPEPGSVNWVINQRIKRGAALQGKQVLRIAENLEQVEAQVGEQFLFRRWFK